MEQHCECGHAQSAHEHYRRGTDCSLCPSGECLRFRAAAGAPNGARLTTEVAEKPADVTTSGGEWPNGHEEGSARALH